MLSDETTIEGYFEEIKTKYRKTGKANARHRAAYDGTGPVKPGREFHTHGYSGGPLNTRRSSLHRTGEEPSGSEK